MKTINRKYALIVCIFILMLMLVATFVIPWIPELFSAIFGGAVGWSFRDMFEPKREGDD